MTEQAKAWAVVDNEGQPIGTYYEKTDLEDELVEYNRIGINPPYKIVELTSTPKIKMTQAEFDEFKKHRIAYPEFSTFLVDAFRKNMFFERLFNQGGVGTKNRTQLDFARLWASDNPEELVEIEKTKQYHLVSKLDKFFGVVDLPFGASWTDDSKEFGKFADDEIKELGGDDWLAEMGLNKIEVAENDLHHFRQGQQ